MCVCTVCREIRDGRMHSMSAAFWVRFSIWLDLQQTREFAVAAKREKVVHPKFLYSLVPTRRESQGQPAAQSRCQLKFFPDQKSFFFGLLLLLLLLLISNNRTLYSLSLNCLYALYTHIVLDVLFRVLAGN